jgi:curved DNA-binding protein CbpA
VTGTPDAYKILQVDPEAEDEVIVAAYRRLARKYHPDVAAGDDAAARMSAINAAFQQIGTPARRAAYDQSRGATAQGRPTPSSTTSSTAASPSGRTSAPERQPGSGTPPGSGPTSASGAREPPATPPGSAPRPGSGAPPKPEPEAVSRDWTSGRSSFGGGYDASMRTSDGTGAAGPPPGNPSGSVLTFGRYAGWSLGEIARVDLEFIEWLDRMPIGRPYRDQIDTILRRVGRRRSATAEATDRRGLFRRR